MTRPLTTVPALIEAGLAAPGEAPALEAVAAEFRVRLTPGMAAAAADPGVAAQFVPDARELRIRPEELADPIGDAAHSPVPGLTHRYPDRVILHVTRTCAVYCRFCFRREVVGEEGALPEAELAGLLARRPVFASAARFEPFGLAVLEAAQAGCPLVLSDIATFRELWDGAAVFVAAGDPDGFAAAIAALLADPARHAPQGAAAQARAARFTPAATAAAMTAIYRDALGSREDAA